MQCDYLTSQVGIQELHVTAVEPAVTKKGSAIIQIVRLQTGVHNFEMNYGLLREAVTPQVPGRSQRGLRFFKNANYTYNY